MASRADLGRLTEGAVLDVVELSRAEAAALNSTPLVTVEAAPRGWRVRAAHAVGALRCGELIVRVQPKVGPIQLLQLLARAEGFTGFKVDSSLVPVAADRDLTSVLGLLFALEARTALAAGPLRGYRPEDQSLTVLRGRLRLREQELRRYGRLLPLEVTVDEWTTDTDDNRRIRAATRRLITMPGLPAAVRDQLVRVDRVLAEVQIAPFGKPPASWVATRLNARLHRLLRLADLVLAHAAVEHRVGDVEVRGFVLSLSWLFERLVSRLMLERNGRIRVATQQISPLDQEGRLKIKPDLLFFADQVAIAVADTKYKLLDDDGRFPNADAYQLLTYCTRLGLDTGHLIYAAGDPCPRPYEVPSAGVRLVVHAIDLARPVPELEAAVEALWVRITQPSPQKLVRP